MLVRAARTSLVCLAKGGTGLSQLIYIECCISPEALLVMGDGPGVMTGGEIRSL